MPDRSGKSVGVPPQFLLLLLFGGLLLGGCKTMPQLYRTSVEAAVGRGDLNLVIDTPGAFGPTTRLVTSFLEEMGLETSYAEMIVQRSDRIALALYGSSRRIALAGAFPAALVRMGSAGTRKEGSSLRVEAPYGGMVLVSSGDHSWMEDAAEGPAEEPFLLPSPGPGSILMTMKDPSVLYKVDQKGYLYKMAEHNSLLCIDAEAVPAEYPAEGSEEGSAEAWNVLIRFQSSDEEGARRVSSVLKTALFTLSRPGDGEAYSMIIAELASRVLKERAIRRDELTVEAGPMAMGVEGMDFMISTLAFETTEELP